MDVHGQESVNNIRFSWNIWPSSRLEGTRSIVPLGCMYTPLKQTGMPGDPNARTALVEYEPVTCKQRDCNAVLNPYCAVDFNSKSWTCPFCLNRNPFPPHYAQHMTPDVRPQELLPNCTTIEYILPVQSVGAPIFLFVVDIAIIEDELEQLKDSIQQAISVMPQNAMVGLITFGTMTYVHELCNSEIPKSYAFRGKKDVTAQQVMKQLNFPVSHDPRGTHSLQSAKRFILPISECEFVLNLILDDLQQDQWVSHNDRRYDQELDEALKNPDKTKPIAKRTSRCTGVAMSVAVGLLQVCAAQQSSRVMMMIGGPATVGPGVIAGATLDEPLRSWKDINRNNNNAKFVNAAVKYYASIAERAVSSGIAVDIFMSSLDQCGLYEMRVVSDKTGGYVVMSDSFSFHVFKKSLAKIFEPDADGYLRMGFNAEVQCITSRDYKVCGMIGPGTSCMKKNVCVSDTEIGEGQTYQWACASLDEKSTLAFYFEVNNQSKDSGKCQSYLQFQTSYNHASGRKRLRVTTISYSYMQPGVENLGQGFDQETAAVLMARFALWKAEGEDSTDVNRWLDKMLIRLASRFGQYTKDDPHSFRLTPEFSLYPQFMFHLRRAGLMSVFGYSPDETMSLRSVMLRENVMNSLLMIQPALLQYSFEEGPPQPALLESSSLKPNVILMLDTFFHVVIWRGDTISAWYEAGYQDDPNYASFKQLLTAPAEDAKVILQDRFPVPKFIQTNANGSQARFLKSAVNPDSGVGGLQSGATEASAVITEDVSLGVFLEHLSLRAVES